MKAKIISLLFIISALAILNSLTTQQITYHPEFTETQTSALFGISTAQAYPPELEF